jgi:hypothetical protein
VIELEERVCSLEEVFQNFMLESSQAIAANREAIAEIRASNARTDRQLLLMQQQADRDRERGDRDREKLTAMMEQADKDREKLSAMMEQANKDREKLSAMMEQANKDRERGDRDREKADLDRERAERERKDFNRRLAEVTDSQGLMIENMVWPNLNRVAKQVFGGGNVLFSGIRLKRRLPSDQGRLMELDLLAAGEKAVLICEAKSKVDSTKVREFLENLRAFPEFFPEFAGLALRPMIASIYFDPSVVANMTSLNVIALGFGDETMEVLNPEALPTEG